MRLKLTHHSTVVVFDVGHSNWQEILDHVAGGEQVLATNVTTPVIN